MDQNRILSFDEFVAQNPEPSHETPTIAGDSEMGSMYQTADTMPIDATGMGDDGSAMDPDAEPIVPELPVADDQPSEEPIDAPNMPSENLSETFKKYGNRHHKSQEESRSGRCKYCGKSIESVGAGSEPRPGMCERCYENGGDDE